MGNKVAHPTHLIEYRDYRKDIMKKRTKEIVKILCQVASSMIILLCGGFAWDIGQEGKAICYIMLSLYLAMWVHAGIMATLINAKFENKKEETSDSVVVEKPNTI